MPSASIKRLRRLERAAARGRGRYTLLEVRMLSDSELEELYKQCQAPALSAESAS